MGFLISDNQISVFNYDSVNIVKELPVGIYKTVYNSMSRTTYLEKADLKLSHGKIYGEAEKNAQHIVDAWDVFPKDKNLGVLLSGNKGLGKTLVCRLVIEKLAEKKPIIIISEYTNDLADFLTNVQNCVIFMDEFEKFMKGSAKESDDEYAQTKQETILSILDGNSSCFGNLFLFTVNNLYDVDNNLKSRPGRIRYHFKFKSETADVVRQYCKDNLKNKDLTEDIVKALGSVGFVSLDIISAVVEELNNFPASTIEEALKCLNIERDDESRILTFIKIIWDDKYEATYKRVCKASRLFDGYERYNIQYRSNKQREEMNKLNIPAAIVATLDESIEVDPYTSTEVAPEFIIIEDSAGMPIKVLGGIIKDDESNRFMKIYNSAAI